MEECYLNFLLGYISKVFTLIKGLGQWSIQFKFLLHDLQRFLWSSLNELTMFEILFLEANCWNDNLPLTWFSFHIFFGIWRKQKAGELDFEELGIVCPGRRDTIVSYNNALFLQRERNPADLVEPLFGSRCSIIRSDLRHCSKIHQPPPPGNNLPVSINYCRAVSWTCFRKKMLNHIIETFKVCRFFIGFASINMAL